MAERRERYLDQHRDEIMMLYYERRYSQARIIKHLEDKYGLEVAKATMSVFINALPKRDDAPAVPPEAEHFLEQYEVFQTLVTSVKGIADLAANVHGRMGVLEDAAAERHKALVEALQQIAQAMPVDNPQQHQDVLTAIKAATQGIESPPDYKPALTTLQESLNRQASDITAIRRSVGPVWSMVRRNAPWMKAFFFTGLFWLAVIAGVMWYYKLWRFLPWKLPF